MTKAMTPPRKKALATIKRNIEKSGFHIYIVAGEQTPRFAYTVGLRESLGAELVLAGGLYYDAQEIWLWDAATRQRWRLYYGDTHIERLWFSPDGTRLAFMDVSAVVHVLDLA